MIHHHKFGIFVGLLPYDLILAKLVPTFLSSKITVGGPKLYDSVENWTVRRISDYKGASFLLEPSAYIIGYLPPSPNAYIGCI